MKTNPSFKIFKFFTPVLFAAVVAALCLTPVTGDAQIFVTNLGNNTIGEYTTSGTTVNSALISSGLNAPTDLAFSGGNLFVTNGGNNTIGEYNATTGATINSSFISSGLNGPVGIVVSSRSSVPDASPTLTLLLLGVGATFGLNLLLHRRSEA